MGSAREKSYEQKQLEEKGFQKLDCNLVIRPCEGSKKCLEIWHISIVEQFDIPREWMKYLIDGNRQHAIFVKPIPQSLSIALLPSDNLKNVLLPQMNTGIGESVYSGNKFEKIPPSLEKTIFYCSNIVHKSGFILKAKENICVYVAQDNNRKVYFEYDLTQRGLKSVPDIGNVEVSHYIMNEVWHKSLNKEEEIHIPCPRDKSHNYPLIFVKKSMTSQVSQSVLWKIIRRHTGTYVK